MWPHISPRPLQGVYTSHTLNSGCPWMVGACIRELGSGCGHDHKRNACTHSFRPFLLQWGSFFDDCISITRKCSLCKPVFCATIFWHLHFQVLVIIKLKPPSISSCTQARLKLILAAATVWINMVLYHICIFPRNLATVRFISRPCLVQRQFEDSIFRNWHTYTASIRPHKVVVHPCPHRCLDAT